MSSTTNNPVSAKNIKLTKDEMPEFEVVMGPGHHDIDNGPYYHQGRLSKDVEDAMKKLVEVASRPLTRRIRNDQNRRKVFSRFGSGLYQTQVLAMPKGMAETLNELDHAIFDYTYRMIELGRKQGTQALFLLAKGSVTMDQLNDFSKMERASNGGEVIEVEDQEETVLREKIVYYRSGRTILKQENEVVMFYARAEDLDSAKHLQTAIAARGSSGSMYDCFIAYNDDEKLGGSTVRQMEAILDAYGKSVTFKVTNPRDHQNAGTVKLEQDPELEDDLY